MICDIILVSHNDVARAGLSQILAAENFNIVGSFASISEVGQTELPAGSLVAVDFSASDHQLDAIQQLKKLNPSLKIVVLADQFDMRTVLNCFTEGVHGYIIKSMKSLPMIMALRLAAVGQKVLPSGLVDALGSQSMYAHAAAANDQYTVDVNLSPREHDVLSCVMAGHSNKIIARELEVCEATVKAHVKNILRKLNLQNRTQAAIWASSHGLTKPCASN